MNRTLLLIVTLALCLVVWFSQALAIGDDKLNLTPEEAAEASSTIIAWLECEECTDGELEAVVKLGKIAMPSLIASLREGPSPASRELLHRHLITSYKKLKEYEKTHPEAKVPIGEEEYMKTYMDNYIALYQARAAIALAAIGGKDAAKAMEEALKTPIRDDVKAVVKESIKRLKR